MLYIRMGWGSFFVISELLEQVTLTYNGKVDDFLLGFLFEFFHCEEESKNKIHH